MDFNLDFLVGHKIVDIVSKENEIGIDNYTMTIDNGDIYEIIPNIGGCVCGDGDADIDGLELLPKDNMITNVEYDEEDEDKYTIFVFYDNEKFSVDVDNAYGFGWYGGGVRMTVKKAGYNDKV